MLLKHTQLLTKKKSFIAYLKQASISGILLGMSCLSMIALATYHSGDTSLIFDTSSAQPLQNWLGIWGAQSAALLLYFFGCCAWFFPLTLLYGVRITLFNLSWRRELDRLLALGGLFMAATTSSHCYGLEIYQGISAGGWLGYSSHRLLQSVLIEAHIHLFLFMLTWALSIIVIRFSSITYLYPLLNY